MSLYQISRLANEATAPLVPLAALDTLFIQLSGTLCNLACRHCFVPSGPKEDRAPMMAREQLVKYLDQAEALGVRDYYVTGGEPMLHPDFEALCAEILRRGPLTVLSNGTLVDEARAARLATLAEQTPYSFDLRISLDGVSADENDPIRGGGSFDAVITGIRRLAAVGFDPIVTVVEHRPEVGSQASRASFLAFLRDLGLPRPRCKFLPLLRVGREPRRTHDYTTEDLAVLHGPIEPDVAARLACSTTRLVSALGVHICPLLLDGEGALLGQSLADSLGPQRLRWSACRTCLVEGLQCRT